MMRLFLRERATKVWVKLPLLAQEFLADKIQPPPITAP